MREVLLGRVRPRKYIGYVTQVDDGDYDAVEQFNWFASAEERTFYALRHLPGRKTLQYMHDFIMGTRSIDHIDHNGLNNQRANLRASTKTQNAQNSLKYRGTSSQYKGVSWSRGRGKWVAYITVNTVRRSLGCHSDEMKAALAYDAAAREAFGVFACLNFPAP